MAITFVGAGSVFSGVAYAATPGLPAGITANDFLFAFCAAPDTSVGDWADDGGDGNGWTQLITNEETTGRDNETAIYYKVAGSSESAPTFSYDGANDPLTSAILAFRGVDTTTPFDVTYNNANHYAFFENDWTPTPPAITTVTNGAWVIVTASMGYSNISGFTAPTGYTERAENTGANRNMALATKEVASAGTETPGSWGVSGSGMASEESVSYTIALKPAAAGGGGSVPVIIHQYKQRRT